MSKTIAVTGATGVQGGAIVRVLLEAGWTVRAITRNANGDAAKALKSKNVEVVEANHDDEASLVKAFEGAHAVFGVTNFWEFLFTGNTPDKSGQLEKVQAINVANAAAKTASLEHFIWSTLPSAKKITKGKIQVPHMDYKAEVDDYIREKLPQLAAKTTYLALTFYTTNIAFFPNFRPVQVPAIDTYIQALPVPASTPLPIAGDMNVSTGIWVRQILANPEKTKTKYLNVETDVLSLGEMYKVWSELTGKRFCYVQSSADDFINIWGPAGWEISQQLEFHKLVPDVAAAVEDQFVTKEEIGVVCPGFKESLTSLKDALL